MEKWNPHPSLVQNGKSLKMLNTELLYDPGIPLLAIPPKIIENLCPHKKVYINVHGCIIPNSPIVQYKCPFTDDYINEYIHTM